MKLGMPKALLVIVTAMLAFPIAADAKLARGGSPSVSFTALGPAGMKIVGTTSELEVSDDPASITVTVPLANLTTGIALRDRHMKEKYLQVPQYPTATLKVDRATLKLPAAGADSSGDAQGTMAIHGKTHAVTFHYSVKHAGAAYSVSGSTHVDMKDYGIDVPSYLGVTVKPDVEVTASFVANES